jgi:hypothetical protein
MRSVAQAVIFLLFAGKAAACICSMPTLADEAEVKEEVELLFVGEVLEVSTKVVGGLEVVHARFDVHELRKGPKTQFVTVEVRHGGTSCDLVRASFEVGERYLISGNEVKWVSRKAKKAAGFAADAKIYYNNYCDLREQLGVTPNKSLKQTRER